jgi:hypothetical protein
MEEDAVDKHGKSALIWASYMGQVLVRLFVRIGLLGSAPPVSLLSCCPSTRVESLLMSLRLSGSRLGCFSSRWACCS